MIRSDYASLFGFLGTGDEGPASRKDLLPFIDKPLRRRLIYSRLPLSPRSNLGECYLRAFLHGHRSSRALIEHRSSKPVIIDSQLAERLLDALIEAQNAIIDAPE